MSGARSETDLEKEIDALYAGPTAEFTERRDALAKKLTAAGDKDTAKAVKARKKPSVIAYVLNQLARRHPDHVAALVDAGRGLARAQRSALRGESDGGEKLRAAMAKQRDVLREASQKVSALLKEDGALKPALLDGVVRALHAALVNPALGEALEQGRLETAPDSAIGDFSITTGDAAADEGIVEAAKKKPHHDKEPTPHRAPPEAKKEAADHKAAAAKRAAAEQKAAEAKAAAAEREAAKAKLAEAEHDATQAEKEADRAAKRATSAEEEATAAADRAEKAKVEAKTAAADARSAAEEAETARATAREARARVKELERKLAP